MNFEINEVQAFLNSLESEADDGHQRRSVDTYMKIIQDFLSHDKNLIKPISQDHKRRKTEETTQEPPREDHVLVFIPRRRQGDTEEACPYLRNEPFQALIPLASFKRYFFRPAFYGNANVNERENSAYLTDGDLIQAMTLLTDCYMKRCGVRSKNMSLAPNTVKTTQVVMRKIGVYSYVFKLLGIVFMSYIFGDGTMVPWHLSNYIPLNAPCLYDEEQDALSCWSKLDYKMLPHMPNAVNHYYLTRIYDFMVGTAKSILTCYSGPNKPYYVYKSEDASGIILYTVASKHAFLLRLLRLNAAGEYQKTACFKECIATRQQDDFFYASFRSDFGEQQWGILHYFCCSHICHEETRPINFVRACFNFLDHPLKHNFLSDRNSNHVDRSDAILKRVRFLMADMRWRGMSLFSLFGRFYACMVLHSDDCFEFHPSKLSFKKGGELIDPVVVGARMYVDMEYIVEVECFPKGFVADEALKSMTVDVFGKELFPDAEPEELFWAAIAFARRPFLPCRLNHKNERLVFYENDLDFLSLVSQALFPLFC